MSLRLQNGCLQSFPDATWCRTTPPDSLTPTTAVSLHPSWPTCSRASHGITQCVKAYLSTRLQCDLKLQAPVQSTAPRILLSSQLEVY
ncbi:hypothetical protein E2C01_071928 [Portunus trituberculatus]|uniref:Uncharacterized protein n=1 Tax=Portunus trituberculatus TaxID=210409 RepID=A0A5B7I9Q9_PORTR|nr:hypothetical protein [Portunus trituberculatus]